MTRSLSGLSIVFPFHNASGFIHELLPTVQELESRGAELVFVDDCSSDDGAKRLMTEFLDHALVKIVCLDKNGGAGTARNIGLEHVTGTHTLFFDIDDRLCFATLERAFASARDTGCDVQISGYSLEDTSGNERRLPKLDRQILDTLKRTYADTSFSVRAYPEVLRLTNYPWNKIARTDFARDIALRFGTTRVQNDVLAHWMLLLHAQRICYFDGQYTTHLVSPEMTQITNDFGPNRLQMFEALEQVERELLSQDRFRVVAMDQFLAFKSNLMAWARGRMKPEAAPLFEARARDHVVGMRVSDLLSYHAKDPTGAAKIAKYALKGMPR